MADTSPSELASPALCTSHKDAAPQLEFPSLRDSAGRSTDTSSGPTPVYDGLIVKPSQSRDSDSQATDTHPSTFNSASSPSSPAVVAYTSTGTEESTAEPLGTANNSQVGTAPSQQHAIMAASTEAISTMQASFPTDPQPRTSSSCSRTAVPAPAPGLDRQQAGEASGPYAADPTANPTQATAAEERLVPGCRTSGPNKRRGAPTAAGLPALFLTPKQTSEQAAPLAPGVIVVDKKGLRKSELADTAKLQVSRMHLCATLLQVLHHSHSSAHSPCPQPSVLL